MSAEVIDRDLGWRALFKRVREIRDSRVKVGVLADTDEGATRSEDGDLTVAEYAGVNEFGTEDGRIPARSFLRSTFDEMRGELVKLGGELIEMVLDGKLVVRAALGILGLKLADGVKAKITTNIPPPDSPATVEHKGSDKTLIDTGRMRQAVTWVVDEGKNE